ncbi:MAG: alanine racemase [Holophagaceae bacterium]|nr:alanine racemase [Holophagaceae bacterium]
MSLFPFADDACSALAEAHGTPLFAYHGPTAGAQFKRLRAALPENVRLAYAVKANPHPELLQQFAALGASFDCASIGELRRVKELSLPPGRIFFAGPGKRREELELALKMKVRIQAEGWEDLARLDEISGTELAVNLRVHPSTGAEEGNRIIGGVGPSAFGVDEEQLPGILERAKALSHVRIRGLHVFAASNQRDVRKLLATHRMVLEMAARLHREHGLDLEQIDLGGGLGVAYSADQPELDVEALGRGLSQLQREHSWFKGELILEPGRFLAAPCGLYLARVVRIKESRGTRFAILEGGINHLLRPLLTGESFPVRAVGKSGPMARTTLAGPLCTSLDRVGEADLPADLAPGDLLAFGRTGAYGFSEGMTHFLSHPVPPEIWVA